MNYTINYNLTRTQLTGNTTIQITPDTGYELPSSITVTNGTLVSYDSTTGIAVLSNVTANTTVSVVNTPLASTFTLSVDAYSSMAEGYLNIKYNNVDVYDFASGEATQPATSPIVVVENATMDFEYWCRYGHCEIYQNGTRIHQASSPYGQFSFTPQANDAITVDFLWED